VHCRAERHALSSERWDVKLQGRDIASVVIRLT
jgi:hypothetical protein